ncbi:TPA: LPXTG cell wall anchor domain-containing protein [Streptococcus suis]|uniref:LPXTG cell wall anchor domain-containing protein n=1 Tax=Streptococcus suis TaxID=1307 RepID=A0A7T1LAH5_STRSU|nr:LPXTG cell wall anchor domain-containing protein [Streptococcus suis]MCQ8785977.1 LPXTG cell wall anchor domain-containing protein [Streptococcus suis]MDW8719404.1 LPXTG cell wall anchor domain-containing protein [Streptococcus suis]NQN64090.1 LPXTG cell wall anchor domain-containing protein [Streptococcus suis]NQR44075.1 LPXTG cell wall anchor domain-containing protein [Streptococcus suis]NQR53815.1 LPXTG cell wall anchor domain-containing protein [Streptococcus suis]
MSTKKTYLLRKTSIGLVSLAALAVVGTTVSANEIGVATAHGTGAYADPIPTFNINTGELTAKGSSVLNSDYKPALDPSTVDITKHGEGVTAELPEVALGFDNGEPYVYAHGTGVTASVELPALDPSTVDITKHGEGLTAPTLNEVAVALDENGLYFTNTPVEAPTAEALPEVQVGGKDGEFYLYAKGEGATVELPTIDPATLGAPIETAKGESVTAPALPVAELPALEIAKGESVTAEELPTVEVAKDEAGEYLFSKGASVTAAELPVIDPATLTVAPAQAPVVAPKVEAPKAEVAAAVPTAKAATSSAKLPETGEASTAVYFATALGLLGAAAVLAKKQEN